MTLPPAGDPEDPQGRSAPEPPAAAWDPGLQPERTRLAWQRTALAILGVGAVVARLMAGSSLVLALVVAGLILAGVCGVMILTIRRNRRVERRLRHDQILPDGLLHLIMTGLCGCVGLGALTYLIIAWSA